MYEADKDFNIIGTENLATFFGKNGTFDDWTVQSGLRWLDLSGRMEGTYPGDPATDFTGPWTGELSLIPTDYFYIPDPGEWWNAEDVADSELNDFGSVAGTITDASGKAVSGATVSLNHISGEYSEITAVTDKDGNFKIEKVPLGGYEFSAVKSNGQKASYTDEVIWIEADGDEVTLSLVFEESVIESTVSEDFDDTQNACKIAGYITDKNGDAISHLTLKLEPFGETVVTDENGYFEFISYNTGKGNVYIISETGKDVLVTALELGAGLVYELRTSTPSGAIIYDAKNQTVSLGVSKKPVKKPVEDTPFNYLPIVIAAGAVVLAGVAVLVAVLLKKRSRKSKNA